MELIQQTKVKAEIQSLSAIAPDFLTNIYLPNKLRYKGWVWVQCRHLVETKELLKLITNLDLLLKWFPIWFRRDSGVFAFYLFQKFIIYV